MCSVESLLYSNPRCQLGPYYSKFFWSRHNNVVKCLGIIMVVGRINYLLDWELQNYKHRMGAWNSARCEHNSDKFSSKYFLTYCFISSSANILLHTALYVIYLWHNFPAWENVDIIKLQVNSRCDYWGKLVQWAVKWPGICCTVVSDRTRQISSFCNNCFSFCDRN